MLSLYDIAPRLALARDQRRMEIAVIDGDDFKIGDEFARIEWARHETIRCPHCRSITDVHTVDKRLLVGCNKGVLAHKIQRRCRSCRAGWVSSW